MGNILPFQLLLLLLLLEMIFHVKDKFANFCNMTLEPKSALCYPAFSSFNQMACVQMLSPDGSVVSMNTQNCDA